MAEGQRQRACRRGAGIAALSLHVIGSSPAMPRPGEPCSCYLVRTQDANVVLDIGSGAFAQLQLAIDYTQIEAIVISHMHADHFFDIVPFRYALKYGHLRVERKPALWVPPGGLAALEALRGAVSNDAPENFFESAFVVREYDPKEPLSIKDLRIRFARTMHYIEAYAMRVEHDGRILTYSSDTAPSDGVVELASRSSLFLCEAALGLGSESGERGHCSAVEAAQMAVLAQAERLVVTHYPWAGADAIAKEASRAYHGPIDLARSGLEVAV